MKFDRMPSQIDMRVNAATMPKPGNKNNLYCKQNRFSSLIPSTVPFRRVIFMIRFADPYLLDRSASDGIWICFLRHTCALLLIDSHDRFNKTNVNYSDSGQYGSSQSLRRTCAIMNVIE